MADKEVKGTAWLAEYVNDQLGTEVDGYKVRILLRSLAKEGVIEREEGRYNFTGPKDPQVVAVLKAVKSGRLEKANTERLDELKAKRSRKAAPVEDDEEESPARKTRARTRKAAATKAAPAGRSRRAKPAPVEDEDDLDIDEI